MADDLVRFRDLKVYYPLFRGFVQRLIGGKERFVHAVDGVSFEILRGEVFGLVGESGCGKSTAGRSLLGLTPVADGEISLRFPTSQENPSFVRPRDLKLACVVLWGLAAAFLGSALAYQFWKVSLLPLGLAASVSDAYMAALGIVGVLQALLGIAIWMLLPWSRRPARLVAAIGAMILFIALPWGLLPLALEVGMLLYFGTPNPTALIRRRGWLSPATQFTLTRRGLQEGAMVAEEPTWFERWIIGPRAVRTSGFSWVVKQLRGKVQIVYQDPHAALAPGLTVGELLEHALKTHASVIGNGSGKEPRGKVRTEALKLLDDVGLRPPEQFHAKVSTDMSGGQKQRAVIARALAPKPLLLVADEPVAMLDMSVRAMILELLLGLKDKYALTFLFITHDLATAKLVCDRVGIMYLGRIVEIGEARRIYADPKHPYTRALLQAIPIPDPSRRAKKVLPKGEVPDAVFPPAGCRFHPRCPSALPTCGWEGRDMIALLEERWLSAELAARESIAGPVETWEADGLIARRHVGKSDPTAVQVLIRSIINESGGPMAQAVRDVRVQGTTVTVEFRPPDPLVPKDVDGRIVECLLY